MYYVGNTYPIGVIWEIIVAICKWDFLKFKAY